MPTVRPRPRIHMALVSDLAPASWVKVTFRYLVLVCTPQNKLVILFSLGLSNIGKGKARFFFFKFAQLKYSTFFKTFFGRAEFRSQSRSRNQISAEASLKKGRLPSAPASQHLALHYCKHSWRDGGVGNAEKGPWSGCTVWPPAWVSMSRALWPWCGQRESPRGVRRWGWGCETPQGWWPCRTAAHTDLANINWAMRSTAN